MGTTRTRAWLVQGERIQAHQVRDFGVRDSSRGLNLQSALIDLLHETGGSSESREAKSGIRKVAAAGMITSPQGLLEIPHLSAPVGAEALSESIRRISLGTRQQYELLLVPGVRTGNGSSSTAATLAADVMRGEETLCIGLLSQGLLRPGDAVLNLGSHWKWIWVDALGRISDSHTSLTGEMIHAVQANTLLATTLPQRPPVTLESEWLALGAAEVQRSGLSRALFCVRLLQQAKRGSRDQHLAFFYGAFLEAEAEAFKKNKFSNSLRSVCIVGNPALAVAWKMRLESLGISAAVVEESQREVAYLAGLRAITASSEHGGS
jgi:2-dehydro-3-deoxygalactonokinase